MDAYSVNAVANAFIELAEKEGSSMTNMKLQKLAYIAQGFCLATLDRPLFENNIHAFEWGPVIPTLYNRLKKYGSAPITDHIPNIEKAVNKKGQAMKIIKTVWDSYKNFTAAQLSTLTHIQNTPWAETWENDRYGIINPNLIKKYYRELIDERSKTSTAF